MPNQKNFNEWFETWPKAKSYEHWSRSQGTGLRRAHSLMQQAGEAYKKYCNRREFKKNIQLTLNFTDGRKAA